MTTNKQPDIAQKLINDMFAHELELRRLATEVRLTGNRFQAKTYETLADKLQAVRYERERELL